MSWVLGLQNFPQLGDGEYQLAAERIGPDVEFSGNQFQWQPVLQPAEPLSRLAPLTFTPSGKRHGKCHGHGAVA